MRPEIFTPNSKIDEKKIVICLAFIFLCYNVADKQNFLSVNVRVKVNMDKFEQRKQLHLQANTWF